MQNQKNTTDAKCIHEKIQTRFKEFAKQIFDEFGEPNALMLMVDWSIGKNDFPPGFSISRKEKITAVELLELAIQLGKMTNKLMAFHGKYMEEAKTYMISLAEQTKQMEERVSELKEGRDDNAYSSGPVS